MSVGPQIRQEKMKNRHSYKSLVSIIALVAPCMKFVQVSLSPACMTSIWDPLGMSDNQFRTDSIGSQTFLLQSIRVHWHLTSHLTDCPITPSHSACQPTLPQLPPHCQPNSLPNALPCRPHGPHCPPWMVSWSN